MKPCHDWTGSYAAAFSAIAHTYTCTESISHSEGLTAEPDLHADLLLMASLQTSSAPIMSKW